MEYQQIFDYVANNGFAIVMCIYMVVVNNKTVKENTETLKSLKTLIENFVHN